MGFEESRSRKGLTKKNGSFDSAQDDRTNLVPSVVLSKRSAPKDPFLSLLYRSCRYSSKQMPRSQISFAISGESI